MLIDIADIVEEVGTALNWDETRQQNAYAAYIDFLKAVAHKDLSPTVDVDAIWHCHLLYSKRYRDDCNTLVGRFIDHEPKPGQAYLALAGCGANHRALAGCGGNGSA